MSPYDALERHIATWVRNGFPQIGAPNSFAVALVAEVIRPELLQRMVGDGQNVAELAEAWREVRSHPFFQSLPDGCGQPLCNAIEVLDAALAAETREQETPDD